MRHQTPAGEEGFNNVFLRRILPVYIETRLRVEAILMYQIYNNSTLSDIEGIKHASSVHSVLEVFEAAIAGLELNILVFIFFLAREKN